VLDPDNLWLLEHLVAIHKKDKNYSDAIIIQKKIAEKHPKKKEEVVYLHLKNKDNKAAKKVLSELAETKMLNSRLRRIRKNLTQTKKTKTVTKVTTVKGSLEEKYVKEKSFATLKKLLVKFDIENNIPKLESYSNEGMNLFPAQPFVYLMHGKALNKEKKYKKALDSLQNGIDFVIDDVEMEKMFYNQLIVSYKGIGDTKNAKKYQLKL